MSRMTMTSNNRPGWRGFLATIDLVTASALADLDAAAEPDRRWRRTFQVELLAAASGDSVELPESGVLSEGSELGVTVTPEDRRLIVRLQLQGFATLDQFGGREARLISENGTINYRFTFSRSGSAICILGDESGIREGLGRCAVYFAEETPSGAAADGEEP